MLARLARYPPLPTGSRVAVVGGFVRDAMLGIEPRELDLVIEDDAPAYARRFPGEVTVYEDFGTATVCGPDWRVDVAMARRERYPAAGALPVVEPATIEEDLERRDFAVNAIAITLDGDVLAVKHALADLAGHQLRVLHDRSFIDDPTRLVRLARYAQRLDFTVEPSTAALARDATLATLSGSRLGAELRLALAEPDPVAVLARIADKLPIEVDRAVLSAALALAPPDADRAMLLLGAVARDDAWLAGLELTARELGVVRACRRAVVPADTAPSALWRAWRGLPIEAVALAGARGDRDAARRWIEELRHVRLQITGDDLIEAGIPEGPEIGRRLAATLERKLDCGLPEGREAELQFAVES